MLLKLRYIRDLLLCALRFAVLEKVHDPREDLLRDLLGHIDSVLSCALREEPLSRPARADRQTRRSCGVSMIFSKISCATRDTGTSTFSRRDHWRNDDDLLPDARPTHIDDAFLDARQLDDFLPALQHGNDGLHLDLPPETPLRIHETFHLQQTIRNKVQQVTVNGMFRHSRLETETSTKRQQTKTNTCVFSPKIRCLTGVAGVAKATETQAQGWFPT